MGQGEKVIENFKKCLKVQIMWRQIFIRI